MIHVWATPTLQSAEKREAGSASAARRQPGTEPGEAESVSGRSQSSSGEEMGKEHLTRSEPAPKTHL